MARGGKFRGGRRGKGDVKTSLEVSPTGDELRRIFEQAGRDFRDWKEPLRKLAPILARGLGDNIRQRGAPIGVTWPRRKGNFPHPPLQRTGALLREVSKNRPLSLRKTSITMGVRGRKETAQKAPRLHFPPVGKRGGYGFEFMGWSPRMMQQSVAVLDRYVGEVMQEAAEKMNRRARRV